ncbi:MAG: LemA family protein [Terriglobia bacterium]
MEWVILAVVIIIIAVIAAAILMARAKASLRRQSGDLNRAWSDIDMLLKRQSDDLPRLLQLCRSYMSGQQESVRLVSESRAAYLKARSIPEKTSSDATLRRALRTLFAEAEQYPELKTNSIFSQLQSDLFELQERIEDRRELFSDEVRRFNNRLQRPPAAWLAAKMKLKPHPLFDAQEKPGSALK